MKRSAVKTNSPSVVDVDDGTSNNAPRQQRAKPPLSSSPCTQEDEKVEPLDVTDQEKIVQEFHDELVKQHELINQVFQVVVCGIMIACVLVTVYSVFSTADDMSYHYGDKAASNASSSRFGAPNGRETWLLLIHGVVSSPLLHYMVIPKTTKLERSFTAQQQQQQQQERWSTNMKLILALALFNLFCLSNSLFFVKNKTIKPAAVVDPYSHNSSVVSLHGGLMVSNLCTMAFSFIIYLDQQSTEKSLQQLKASKYHFKSL